MAFWPLNLDVIEDWLSLGSYAGAKARLHSDPSSGLQATALSVTLLALHTTVPLQ